ncbi:hypothetical protein LOD99_9860 [Oopsacas minuta]|uniref:HAT C-terminal dimerisation domain-containing protein n=1 Tax=Oopsacas minuta TaxID=111878 RepID=A0AAV7KLY7_9METZ|nr:hypothetical protein LOD99_9860 [Oopsacas minuta]
MDQDDPLLVNASVSDVVNKVRRVVKLFKRSPLKNEILQTYVKEKHPNGLQLILDCRTRWSTLLNILERIVKLRIPIHKALLDLDIDIKLNDEEFQQINNIAQTLGPIKVATHEVTYVNEVDDMIPTTNSASQEANTLPVAMKLQLAIDASLQVSQKQQPSDESLPSSLKHELNIAEQTGERSILLEKVYRMLLTIQPTSVEAERIFSSCAYLCNKFRSSLSDKSLDILCLIRNNNK